MSRAANPFRPGVVLALLAVGAAAFLLLLYALGQGWTGEDEGGGDSHGAANGLNGFSGLVELLDGTGHEVSLSRNPSDLSDYALAVITPPLWSDPAEIDEIIQGRIDRGDGPTLLVLPKWQAWDASMVPGSEAEDGWVILTGAQLPAWFAELGIGEGTELAVGRTGGWQGLQRAGDLPDESQALAMVEQSQGTFRALVVDDEGDVLAAQYEAKGDSGYEAWPVVVVFEPDLLNNYGLADRERAALAVDLVDLASDGGDLPIHFDLTLHGLGASRNLLTLAFEPPFLAATLCLLLAALVIAWRVFRRFGPPVAEAAAIMQGKRQLARNGASLVERVRRWHLLKRPYEDMVSRRLAAALGLRAAADTDTRERAIDRALANRGLQGPPFSRLAGDLRAAQRPREIVRAARALRTLERTVTR